MRRINFGIQIGLRKGFRSIGPVQLNWHGHNFGIDSDGLKEFLSLHYWDLLVDLKVLSNIIRALVSIRVDHKNPILMWTLWRGNWLVVRILSWDLENLWSQL